MKVKYNEFLNYKLNENLNQVRKYLKANNLETVEDEAGFTWIKNALKNNPNYLLPATKFYAGGVPKDKVIELFNKIKQYKQLMKNNGFDFLEYFTEMETVMDEIYNNNGDYKSLFETLSDKLELMIIENEKQKFVKKFISNKYKHLVNDDTVKLFHIIKDDLDISDHKVVQGLITKKLAAYKSPEEFNKALKGIINQVSGGKKKILKTIEDNNINLIHQDDEVIIVNVETYEQICKIGTENWCIVRDKYFFEDYVNFPNKQYVIFDLTKDNIDPLYMLGVTIDHKGNSTAAHDMEDEAIEDEVFKKWRKYLKPMSREVIEENIHTLIQAIDYDSLDKYKEFVKDSSNDPYQLMIMALQKDSLDILYYMLNEIEEGDRRIKFINRVIIRSIDKEDFKTFKLAIDKEHKFKGIDSKAINSILFQIGRVAKSISEIEKYTKYVKYVIDNYGFEVSGGTGHMILHYAYQRNLVDITKLLFNYDNIYNDLSDEDKDFYSKELKIKK